MTAAADIALPVHAASERGARVRHRLALIVHLTRQEIKLSSRFSTVGALWPLLRQLAQLAVITVAFTAVLDLGIPNYAAFVLAGLVGWTWFVSAMTTSADAIRWKRELAMRPGFPTLILPVLAVTVPLFDVLLALPLLFGLLVFTAEVHAATPLLLPLLLLQGLLMVGLGWVVSSVAVFLRDVPQIVTLFVTLGFYITPIYFDVSRVPADYQWIIRLNPMAVLLEAQRAALLGTPWPPVSSLMALGVLTVVLLGCGFLLFTKLSRRFADEL